MNIVFLKVSTVAIGGAIGAVMRYSAAVMTATWFKDQHYSTMLVNVIGSLLIGYILNWVPHDGSGNEFLRLALVTGVLGGFTTFSAFSLDTLVLMQTGEIGKAMINVSVTLIGTLMAVYIGHEAGRIIHGF